MIEYHGFTIEIWKRDERFGYTARRIGGGYTLLHSLAHFSSAEAAEAGAQENIAYASKQLRERSQLAWLPDYKLSPDVPSFETRAYSIQRFYSGPKHYAHNTLPERGMIVQDDRRRRVLVLWTAGWHGSKPAERFEWWGVPIGYAPQDHIDTLLSMTRTSEGIRHLTDRLGGVVWLPILNESNLASMEIESWSWKSVA